MRVSEHSARGVTLLLLMATRIRQLISDISPRRRCFMWHLSDKRRRGILPRNRWCLSLVSRSSARINENRGIIRERWAVVAAHRCWRICCASPEGGILLYYL